MFQALHSSAGAGKTHALVRHYLLLALREDEPGAYGRILALTFTNKAASEMRERIITYLEGLAAGTELTGALANVRDTLVREAGLDPATVRERAARTLIHILHHWPQLAVSTIDAFTRRVVMPFARDLQMDSELRMTTEEKELRARAVDRLLEDAGSDPALTTLLTSIGSDLVENEDVWRVDRPLLNLSDQLTKEAAIDPLLKLQDSQDQDFVAIQRDLRRATHTFRERLRTLGRNALAALAAEGINADDLAYGKNGPWSYLNKLAVFDVALDPNDHVRKAMAKDAWTSGKASASVKAAVERTAPLLRKTIQEVEDLRGSGELGAHTLRCAVLEDLLPAAGLHLLSDRLETVKREEALVFFSDLVKKVAAIVQREPAPFLYERLGEKYRHFLIDEFQDTSLLQWHALLPLITNALSTGGTALLVGDAKQAIYRWRNGEARQFTALPHLFGKERLADGDVHEGILLRTWAPIDPLLENRRSARAVIAFNNDLFAALRDTLPEKYRIVYDAPAQLAVNDHEGLVRVACFAKPEKNDAPGDDEHIDPDPLVFTAGAVREALDDGFKPGDIAVLVRSGNQGNAVAAHLVVQGHQVVSPDALSLGADPGARTAMALLAWTCRPDDVSAAQAVQLLALLRPDHGTAPERGHPAEQMRTWCSTRPAIHPRAPLHALLHAILRALDLDPSRDAFALGLLNEAHTFAQEHGSAIPAFLEHWERTARKRPVGGATNKAAVQVMTVHKSKGLEFPVVIVPFADMLGSNKRDRQWIDPRPTVPELPAALVTPNKVLDALGIPAIEEEKELGALDVMDLIYVAFTRPVLRLYAAFDGRRKSGAGHAACTILGLGPGDRLERGTRSPAPTHTERDREGLLDLHAPMPAEPVRIRIRQEAPTNWDPVDPDPFRAHGKLLHAILARTHVTEDLAAAVESEAAAAGVAQQDKDAIHQRLAALLARPDVAPFFAPGLRTRTEATLIDAHGHAHRPDRLTTDGTGTRVLDIKTGAPSPAHHEQVALYMRLLRELGETSVSGYLLYVSDGGLVEVL
ncbi:MAG TPA: UvrD-helicase domain-containing protein [Flavobacteriales bacterium]|nr:UvrD-helicase domain-containing protein [Flavobacteriales bacterium]